MGNDFASGMKDVMSLFMMSSMAANYDAQRENMEENRQLRAANLKRQEIEDARQTRTADMETVKLLSNPTTNVPTDIALPVLNNISQKYGGETVKLQDVQAYEKELDAFPQRTDLADGDSRRAAFQPYMDKAVTHAAYARAYGARKGPIEDYLQEPGAKAAFLQSGFTEENADHLLKQLKPAESMKLLKDNDWRKQAIYNQASEIVRRTVNGDPNAEGQLQQALAAAHGAGFNIGVDAANIVKGTTGEAQYNLMQKDLNSLNETTVKPLSKMWSLLDQEKLSLAIARKKPNESLSTIGLEMDDVIASALPQEMQKDFHKVVANLEAANTQASKAWKDFDARYKIAKAQPTTTPADMILLDQQRAIEHPKYRAVATPFSAFKSYTDAPTAENFQKVLKAGDQLDETLRRSEKDKQALMTEAEKAAAETTLTGKTTRLTKEATNKFGTEFMRMAGEHPEIYDNDGTMDVSKASKLAVPIADAINKEFGAHLDASQIVREFAAAGKRSVPKSDTNIKLTAEEAGKFEMVHSGWQDSQLMAKQLINADGSVNRAELAKAWSEAGVPWTSGRDFKSYAHSAIDAILRPRTGAAVKEEEWPKYESMYMPKVGDSDATIKQKLERLENVGAGTVDLVDPQGILRKRIPERRTAVEISGNKPEAKAAPASKGWDEQMDQGARELIKQHPDWSIEQIYKELTKGLK